jgi:hypothetical protein
MLFNESIRKFDHKKGLIDSLRSLQQPPGMKSVRYYRSDNDDAFFQDLPSEGSFDTVLTMYEDCSPVAIPTFLHNFLTVNPIPIVIQSRSIRGLSISVLFAPTDTVQSVFNFCYTFLNDVLRIAIGDRSALKLFRMDDARVTPLLPTDRIALESLHWTPVLFSFDEPQPNSLTSPRPPRKP